MPLRATRAAILASGLALSCGPVPTAVADVAGNGATLDARPTDAGEAPDASHDAPAPPGPTFCGLAGPAPATDVRVPDGYCARSFARVQHARVLRFAPGGELFVASPNAPTAGYGPAGPEPSRIAYVADDDRDGVGEVHTFMPDVDQCHGLLFTQGTLYFTVGALVLRMPYAPGQRAPAEPRLVANLTQNASLSHWPHTLDEAPDGTVYVTRGGDETPECTEVSDFRGGVVALDPTQIRGRPVARGLRNPIYLRCRRAPGGRCFANELTGDYWDRIGGTEKLVEVRDGDDWGYPCCVRRGLAAPGSSSRCETIAEPAHTLPLHETPFGMDYAPASWPEPFAGRLFVALHGSFGSWAGARLVSLEVDETSGAPAGTPDTFASGWDDGTRAHGRPADVTFAPDGRLFLANDVTGEIVWIAPVGLPIPPR